MPVNPVVLRIPAQSLLFKANFGRLDHDGTVLATLRRSMEILSEVYYYDRRKAYHAKTYADQALKYNKVYHSDLGRSYLETALRWLNSELRSSPWNKSVRRLLEQVKRALPSN